MAKRAILEEDDDTEPIEVREETRGRPTKYNAQLFPRQAKLLATRGATQHEIAEIFGVSTSTLKVWLARYPFRMAENKVSIASRQKAKLRGSSLRFDT
jgi:transposase